MQRKIKRREKSRKTSGTREAEMVKHLHIFAAIIGTDH